MAKNTKQIALMKQKSGKLNEIPKQLDDRVFGLAYDANRVFIGNLKSQALQERYESNTFPYGNLELLTEFAPLTDLIKYSPNMNGEKLYYTLEIIGTIQVIGTIEESKIKINNKDVEFASLMELVEGINNNFKNIEAEIVDNKIVIRTTADELVLEDDEEYIGSLARIGLSPYEYFQTALTKRSLQEILDDRYSIKSFNVLGDGVSNDSTKINEAIKIISLFNKSDKKQLFFPADTYIAGSSIKLMSDAYLKGEGIDRTFIKSNMSDPLLIIDSDLHNNIVVEGFTFDISSSSLNLFPDRIINLTQFNSLKFKDCKFVCNSSSNFVNSNDYFSKSYDLVFENCIFEGNNSSNGSLFLQGNLDKFLITNCIFENIKSAPIQLNGGNQYIQNGIIANNQFKNCAESFNKHNLVHIGNWTKYISVIKSLVDEIYYLGNNEYVIMNRTLDEDGRYTDDNYCDTPFLTTDKNKYLRFNFYQSVYDYVQELYNKFGKTAIAVISPESDEEILNYFQLKQGTNEEDLTIEALNQVKDVYFNLGEYADLHLGKDSGIIDNWKSNHTYNILEKIKYNNETYRCIETHTSGENFDESKWTIAEDIIDWVTNTEYSINDLVYYNDRIYKCIEAHTSNDEFDEQYWENVDDKYSKIVLHKQLDLNSNAIISSSGNIVLKPNEDTIIEIDDNNYMNKISVNENAVPTVGYVNYILNPKNKKVLDSNTIDQIVSDTNEMEVDLFDFNREFYGNDVNLKDVSVNIRQIFVPISEQIMALNPSECSMLDWKNKIIYSNNDYGKLNFVSQTVTRNKEYNDYCYVLSLHFDNGILPIIIKKDGTQIINYDYYQENVEGADNNKINSASWVRSYVNNEYHLINTYAWDSPDVMVWDTVDGYNVDNMGYLDAINMNWDEGHLVNGHASVITERFSFELTNEYLKVFDTYNDNAEILNLSLESDIEDDDYGIATWYLGDVVKTTFNDTLKLYVCVKEHYASTAFEDEESCFNDDLFKGYWKQLLLDVTHTVNMLHDDGYDYTEIHNTRYPDITFINYINRGSASQLPVVRNYIDTVPDVKYLSISSTDENDEVKWLFELDDVNIHKRNNGGINYPYWEANHTYNNGDIARFNYADYKCIAVDDNNQPTTHLSVSTQIDLHDSEIWEKINTTGYNYQINFEKTLLKMNSDGSMYDEDYVLSHNFAGCKFKLGLFDKDKKPVILEDKSASIMAEYLEDHVWQINETVYQGYYVTNNNKTYIANQSYTTYGIVDEISNNLLTEINSKEWIIDGIYYINQYITNGSGDELKYYQVIKNSKDLDYYKASDNIEDDVENGYLKYIPSKYLQIGPSGQIIVTVNYDRG